MIAIIFEVWPSEGGRDEYLDIAASLRPHLEAIDGFVSVERFQSPPSRASCCRCPSFATRQR